MKKKIERKLQQELDSLEKKIIFERSQIEQSQDYLLMKNICRDKSKEQSLASTEIETLRNQTYKKYMSIYRRYGRCRLQDIKPSIKQAIKKGLGEKNIKVIEYHLVGIIKRLVDMDLKETNIKELMEKSVDINKDLQKLNLNREQFVLNKLKILESKCNKIYKILQKDEIAKNKKLEKGKAEVKIKMEHIQDYMGNIIKEVNKRLILNGL